MGIKGLTIIGESINDSVPSTQKLFEAGDVEGLKALAREQDERGADYIDVNVGIRAPEFMARIVQEVQRVTMKPVSIDTPDLAMARAGLEAYNADRAGGRKPILNSVGPLRLEMLDLYRTQPFRPVFLISERSEGGASRPNRTGEDVYAAARDMLEAVRESGYEIPNDDLIFDPGIAPIGSDTEGLTRMVLDGFERIHGDPAFAGCHLSVGLSNFTVMLPSKRPDGSPVKSALENAFLTLAIPLGLDMCIGSVKRNYGILPAGHPALVCLQEVLKLTGYDCVIRVMEFYSS